MSWQDVPMVKETDLTESLGFVICFVCLFQFICEKTQMKEKGKLRKIAWWIIIGCVSDN